MQKQTIRSVVGMFAAVMHDEFGERAIPLAIRQADQCDGELRDLWLSIASEIERLEEDPRVTH